MSDVSLSLIVKHLSADQQKEVCSELVRNVLSNKSDSPGCLIQLCELLKVIPGEISAEYYNDLLGYSTTLISNLDDSTKNNSFSSVTLLSEQYPRMSQDLIEFALSKIEKFYSNNKVSFERSLIEISEIQTVTSDDDTVEVEEIKHLFKFLETLFIASDVFHYNAKVDSLCYIFLGSNDEELSSAALKVLKWRLDSICESEYTIGKLWKVIFELMKLDSKSLRSSGYILWLKFFQKMKLENLSSNVQFQAHISSAEYWINLKKGLISSTHEHKKYSLTLIQITLQVVSVDIDNSDMKWVASENDKYVSAWKRFCTLFEITAIDTSVNQTFAAFPDLNALFSPSSLIPVGFSLCILAVGFSNALDSVRKLFLQFVFSLDQENLHVFKHGGVFLEEVFLPFAILAKNYKVIKTIDDVYECEFGLKLQNFVSNCVLQLSTVEEVASFSEIILNILLKYKLAFDPAKIYLGFGLLNGLQRKNIKGLNGRHINLLCSLMTSHSEGDVFDTTLQTIYLRLLLYADVKSCDLHSLFQSLGSFVTNNGYTIFNDNDEFFIDFITENYQRDELMDFFNDNFESLDVETIIPLVSLVFSIYGSKCCTSVSAKLLGYPSIDLLLVTMLQSKIDFNNLLTESLIVSKLERLIDGMLSGSTDLAIEVYSRSEELVESKTLFNEDFWMSIDLQELFEVLVKSLSTGTSVDDLGYAVAQYKFFTECFKKCIYNENFSFKIDDIIDISKRAFLKQNKSDSLVSFYRQKDEFYGLIATCTSELLKITSVTPEVNTIILNLCEEFAVHVEFNCPLACVRLMSDLIEVNGNGKDISLENANHILDNMTTTWTELTSDRLVLSHRVLHQNFIRLLMNKTLLGYSIEDEELADKIFTIADDVIDQSYFRKALLPVLFKSISDYQLESNELFEKTHWISKLLVHGNHLLQTDHNLFKLDIIIAKDIYNKSLNMSGVDLYERVYGSLEVSYKVLIAAIAASIKSTEFVEQLWDSILDNEKVYHMHIVIKPKDAAEQGKRIQLLQLMLLTIKSLSPELCLHYMKSSILKIIFKEPSPLCRMYMEWMIAYCIYTLPSSKDEVFDFFIGEVLNQKPSVVTMFERISFLVAHQLNNVEEAKELTEFISTYLLPASTSNRAVNRHFSVSLICSIYPEILRKDLKIPSELIQALKGIYELAEGADGFGTHRHGDALLWNIVDDLNLVGVCGGVLLKISDREVDVIRDYTFKQYMPQMYEEFLQIPIGQDEVAKWIQGDRSNEIISDKFLKTDVNKNMDPAESSLLQIKSGAWSTVLEELDDDNDGERKENIEGSDDIRVAVKRSQLIVVSSLVDKAPNLGGICRLCDVLGAGWMTVDNIKIKDDFEFQTVAVTADRWMPIIEVKIEQIAEFMRMKKKEGYTLIGLEQTDKSVELNGDLKFPEKSLILLGKEKEGIPGELLAELDMCVIIKQVGIIRSMNIQTATAVIVHAYSSQHC